FHQHQWADVCKTSWGEKKACPVEANGLAISLAKKTCLGEELGLGGIRRILFAGGVIRQRSAEVSSLSGQEKSPIQVSRQWGARRDCPFHFLQYGQRLFDVPADR